MKKDKKAFMVGALCGSLVFGSLTAFAISYTAEPVNFKVLVNGTEFNSDPPAMTINGNTYLPLRAVGDALGVAVNWNSELNQAEVGGGTAATTPQLPATPSTQQEKATESINKNLVDNDSGNGFVYRNVSGTYSDFTNWIQVSGEIENKSDKTYSHVDFTVNGYDKNGILLVSGFASVSNIKSNEATNFIGLISNQDKDLKEKFNNIDYYTVKYYSDYNID